MPRAAKARTETSPTGSLAGARSAAGFTLLELLVVLVLLAVVAAIGGTMVVRGTEAQTLGASVVELTEVLRRARSEAIVRNAPVTVTVDVAQSSFGIGGERVHRVPDSLRLGVFAAAGGSAAVDETADPGAAVEAQPTTGDIRFFPDGSSTGGEVTLANETARRYVQVDWLTGRVRVYEEDGR